jgi:DedD protein
LGAYAEAKVAADLLAKLKAAHFPAYAELLDTSQGKLHRVRVGPYPTREKADAARAMLKDKGHSGIVTPVR